MKKYTDQGKVDTRSGFGAGLVEAGRSRLTVALCLVFICCSFSSCIKEMIEKCKYPDKEFFFWSIEYEVNGERYEEWWDVPESSYWRNQEREFNYLPGYTGIISSMEGCTVDYPNLSFNLGLDALSSGAWFFHIIGPEDGPFEKDVVYSSPNDIALYHPRLGYFYNYGGRSLDYIPGICHYFDWFNPPTFNGFEVKVLSSAFRFKHSIKERVGKVLNFYFDFEEVITSVPQEWDQYPTVGDTIRITNGHFVQAPLGFDFLERLAFE